MNGTLMEISESKTPATMPMDDALMDTPDAEFAQSALIRYERPLTQYAQHLTGDRERARDVVQDTFLKLCCQKPSRIRGYLAQWLYTVCRNRALDVRRKERRMAAVSDARLEMRAGDRAQQSAEAERKEQLEQVLQILGTLPPNQQEVLRLKFQSDLSYGEISRITRLSVGNVGFLIHTGLKTIREKVQGRPQAGIMRRVK